MSDEVTPALTPEEWSKRKADRGHSIFGVYDVDGSSYLSVCNDDWDTSSGHAPETLPSIIALANATLPDASPYKITRADCEFVEWVGHYGQNPGWMTAETADRLLALANKLAALSRPTPRKRKCSTSPLHSSSLPFRGFIYHGTTNIR